MMRIGLCAVDAGQLAQTLHELVGSAHRTRQRAADADVKFPRSRLTKTGIKRHYLKHLDRFEVELGGNPFDRRRGDEAEMMLHNVQQRQCRGPFACRVMRNSLVRLGLKLGLTTKGGKNFAPGVSCEATDSSSGEADMEMMRLAANENSLVSSSIALAHDEVERAEDCRNVGDHVTRQKF